MDISTIDASLIRFFQKISVPSARIGLFVVFFWFGLLKTVGLSPASELVQQLFERTIPFISFDTFLVFFGFYEMLIGMLFLIKGFERIVIPLLLLHMITTMGPLVLLPQTTWQGFFVPTLEGQYIIKNIALIACAIGIAAKLQPIKAKKRMR